MATLLILFLSLAAPATQPAERVPDLSRMTDPAALRTYAIGLWKQVQALNTKYASQLATKDAEIAKLNREVERLHVELDALNTKWSNLPEEQRAAAQKSIAAKVTRADRLRGLDARGELEAGLTLEEVRSISGVSGIDLGSSANSQHWQFSMSITDYPDNTVKVASCWFEDGKLRSFSYSYDRVYPGAHIQVPDRHR